MILAALLLPSAPALGEVSSAPPEPIALNVAKDEAGVELTWLPGPGTGSGVTYRIYGYDSLDQPTYLDDAQGQDVPGALEKHLTDPPAWVQGYGVSAFSEEGAESEIVRFCYRVSVDASKDPPSYEVGRDPKCSRILLVGAEKGFSTP